MAEPLLSFVAERIIEALCSPAVKGIGLFWGVKDDLQSLTDTVSTIKDVLLDAEDKQAAGDRAVQRWLGRLEDIIHDADDLLEEVSTEALRRDIMIRDKKAKKVRIFFYESTQLAFRFRMVREIKAIRKKLDVIDADSRRFSLKLRRVEPQVGNRETQSWVRKETVIGREDDKKAVLDLLKDSNCEDNVSILPIVGIGGLGKTTLAQFVFQDHQIQGHFELKMWVCVSDIFDVKNIVAKVLESATKEKPEDAEMDTLVGKLREKIEGKKYFLVLDDVWNGDHEKWCSLKQVLMGGARGSRIVVTTRNEFVARTIRQESVAGIIGTVKSYSLKGLDEDASWSLFRQKAFERGREPENSSIVALGKEIVKKCSGVPLAISTIGSLLGSKNSETEWLPFKNDELSKISQNETSLLPTLKLSYSHLPSHLKQCFAYCSLFPKDYKFDTEKLIRLWIAQGFVKASDDQSRCLEEVGREYFMNLLWRSFFQEAETVLNGEVYECKMHDLMHDLAISVSGSLMATLGDKETKVNEKTRHLSLLRGYGKPISSLCEASRIRTFLCFNDSEIECDAICSSFKLLRMLDRLSSYVDYVPSSIGEMKYLRCLDLSYNRYIKKLPDSITRLLNLQELILYKCKSLEELPRDIKKLVNLRRLDIGECGGLTYMPRGLGQLNNLETLTDFVVHSGSHFKHCGDLRELNALNKLRGRLEIRNLGCGKDVALELKTLMLKEKQHLRELYLEWSTEGDVNDWDVVDDKMPLEGFEPLPNLKVLDLRSYPGSRLPSWVFSLTNLERLYLRDCHTLKSIPEWIHNFKSLEHFTIYGCSSLTSLPEGMGRLTSLKTLRITNCCDLERVIDEDGVQGQGLTNLLSLCFIQLPKVVSLPSGLQHATTLQELRIRDCPILKAIPEWVHNFKSLEVFTIEECSSLTSLPEGMGRLTSLKRLTIENCCDLERVNDEDGMQGQGLTNLLSLCFKGLPKLVSLPSALQHATSLQDLQITDCEILAAIPEWIHNFKSLEDFTIGGCSSLTSLLEGMGRLTSLKRLEIWDCPNLERVNDEDGMQGQGLTSLLSLHFSGLPKLVSLPSALQHATSLQKLKIWRCESLAAIPEWVHNFKSLEYFKIVGCSSLTSLPEGMGRLTSLKRLRIRNCLGLERVNDEDGMQGQGLTSLLSLHFSGLPKLVSLPSALQHATSLQKLKIKDCKSLKAIPEWIHNFKSLEDFTIEECSSLTSLPEGMGRLTSLKILSIGGCSSLTSLPEGMGRLTSLKSISIWNCLDLERVNDEDGVQGQGLTSLLNLDFIGLPKLVSLPSALQHATSLQKLNIEDCKSLKAIPEWIHNFKSLEIFRIEECSRLTSLPEGMGRLTSLKRLRIENCPILLQRCKRDTGEDWAKIAHIPTLDLQ